MAGLLFLVGSLATIPVHQLWDPGVPDRAYAITALGIVSGLICALIPWDRLGEYPFRAIPAIASIEVGITMWGVETQSEAFVWFLVFVVVWTAYALDERRAISVNIVLAVLVAWYPVTLATPDDRINETAETLIAVPILLVAAAVVVFLRERLLTAAAALGAQARSDALTGVGNYRLLEERLEYELLRHRRSARPLAVLVLDLDGFKQVNDTLGHPVGDQLLRQVADALQRAVRDQDTVVRQGGDEFCVLAPETDAEEAAALVERIRGALGEVIANGLPLSASLGFATFPADATSAELLLAQADHEQRLDKAASRGSRGGLRAVR
ncbi:MAG: diguanylate cyclase/phosphodiesterase (GGDEF & EAL domains) with PAS/PAC sensor(s) [uncultured Solirubrobacteraceae bacterium]|uniref:Diguanylate cyclase/phosphodiesterase (GGDEF & EAL domains) with PAS/PAC sensor(S) n=1 Tax=uncultured Solirubrobacteraceae bacterium TaxID=1162706 RepID=A0A6J4SLU2_9ACTN|nr:MAG: diguanylate cyclase/phosphodiesterase (GGDEF & EAL domains) with PAS/PAC sensor(s) [uncultured Solirubrobacteraceae bacterium]